MACCTMPAVPGITEVGRVYKGTCENIPIFATSSAVELLMLGQELNINRMENGN